MKVIKKVLCTLMVVIMCLTSAPLQGFVGLEWNFFAGKASALDATGQCGDNVYWAFDETSGELTISGIGEMWDVDFQSTADFPLYRDSKAVKSVLIMDGVTSIGYFMFAQYSDMVKVSIPDSVVSIGDYAFYGCSGLMNLMIPDSVTEIGNLAFGCCVGLEYITVDKNNLCYFNDEYGVLFNKDQTTLIKYPAANVRTSYTIPESVIAVDDFAFFCCGNLTSIIVPESVKSLGDHSFGGCYFLSDFTLPNSVTSIGDYAFSYNWIMTSITIPDSVVSIGDYAFSECFFTNVTISDSVKYIGKGAFSSCIYLTDVYYTGTEEQWNAIAIGEENEELLNAIIHFSTPIHTHKYTSAVTKEATCTKLGIMTYQCACGDSYKEEIPALGHDYSTQWTVDIEATCTMAGSKSRHCNRCDSKIDITVISATHTPKTITVPASCTVSGMTYTICEICGETIGEPTILPAAHTPGEWETVQEPTITAEGKKELRCTVCGEIIEEAAIPMLQVVSDKGIDLAFPADDYDGEVDVTVEESFDGTAFDIIDTSTNTSQKVIYDIKMTLNGEEIQPNGKVTIRIPLPAGYDPTRSFVYHVNTVTGKVEKMDARYEAGYLVFETDHFSYYAILEIAEANPSATCKCNCHKSGIVKFFFNIILFFQRIFKQNKTCVCGVSHY